MQVLNVRNGEEGLTVRNAMVQAYKIQHVSIRKQIPPVPFGEVTLAGRDLAALRCQISAI